MAAEAELPTPGEDFAAAIATFLGYVAEEIVQMSKEDRRLMADEARALLLESESFMEFRRYRGRPLTVKPQQAIVAARTLGRFSVAELAKALGITDSPARQWVERLKERGIVDGHPQGGYRYVPPEDSGTGPRRLPVVEIEAVKSYRGPVSQGQAIPRTSDPRTTEMLRKARDQGCEVVQTGGGHIAVLREGSRLTTVSKTPSDNRAYLNARARLRAAGLNV